MSDHNLPQLPEDQPNRETKTKMYPFYAKAQMKADSDYMDGILTNQEEDLKERRFKLEAEIRDQDRLIEHIENTHQFVEKAIHDRLESRIRSIQTYTAIHYLIAMLAGSVAIGLAHRGDPISFLYGVTAIFALFQGRSHHREAKRLNTLRK